MVHQLLKIDDICELFGLSRSSAYALTRRPGFPPTIRFSPRTSRWEEEAVLEYRERLRQEPPKPRPRRVNRPVPHKPGQRIAGRRLSMSTDVDATQRQSQRQPSRVRITTPESIIVYSPAEPGGRWRALWTEPDGRRAGCLARSEAQMAARLVPVTARIRLEAVGALHPGSELVQYYLSQDWRPADRRWSKSYAAGRAALCARYVTPVLAGVRCGDITEAHLRRIVDQATSASAAKTLSALATNLAKAGFTGGYVTDEKLTKAVLNSRNVFATQRKPPVHGHSASFVVLEAIPGHADVAALATAAALGREWWLELAVILTANSGMRWGEFAALDTEHIDAASRRILIAKQTANINGHLSSEAPKGGKTRVTVYPKATPNSYPLAEMVQRRLEEAVEEHKAGSNPLTLLFPAPRGGWLRKEGFHRRVLAKAYRHAGWRDENGEGQWTWHSLRHVFCTTALNNWGMRITDVSALAGHSNTHITSEMYTNPMEGFLEQALRATSAETLHWA